MEALLLTTDTSSPLLSYTKKVDKEMTLYPVTEEKRDRACFKCGKVLATAQALQKHLNKVFLCDRKGVRRNKQDMKISSSFYRCRRCGKTLSSAAGLRCHLPCATSKSVQQQPMLAKKRKDDNSPAEQFDQSSTKFLNLSKRDKARQPVKGSLDEYLSTVALTEKNLQQQKRTENLPAFTDCDNTKVTIASSSSVSIKRKWKCEDSKEEMSPIGESNKRVRSETVSFARLAAQILKREPSPDPPKRKEAKLTNTATTSKISQERKANHGGNILTDGCCCRQCVRKWTRKMMNRLKCLGDEVTSLRQLVQSGQSTQLTSEPSTAPHQVSPEPNLKVKKEIGNNTASLESVDSSDSQGVWKEISDNGVNQQTSAETKVTSQASSSSINTCTRGVAKSPSAKDPLRIVLTEKYNQVNGQIITNERALEDSVAYLKEISQVDESSSSELCSQLDELRGYIDVEKVRRDEAVAAIIAQRWSTRRVEFRLLLENMATKSKPSVEKGFHEECAEITYQLEEKNKVLSKLGCLIGTIGLNVEKSSSIKSGGETPIPKYAVERTAKSFLERQRDDIFMCLLRSSPRIYLLTKELLVKSEGTVNNSSSTA